MGLKHMDNKNEHTFKSWAMCVQARLHVSMYLTLWLAIGVHVTMYYNVSQSDTFLFYITRGTANVYTDIQLA